MAPPSPWMKYQIEADLKNITKQDLSEESLNKDPLVPYVYIQIKEGKVLIKKKEQEQLRNEPH